MGHDPPPPQKKKIPFQYHSVGSNVTRARLSVSVDELQKRARVEIANERKTAGREKGRACKFLFNISFRLLAEKPFLVSKCQISKRQIK